MEEMPSSGRRTEVLSKIYYDLDNPAGFTTSPKVLLRKAREEGLDVTLKDIEHFLAAQVAFTRHKQPTRKFPRRKILILRPDDCWACDLAFVDALSDYNNGFSYLLVVTDIFSSKIWLRKLRKKTAKEVELNFRSIIQENGGTSPNRLWSDRGTVWTEWTDGLKCNGIDR